jgi:sporulation protein YlmC with PRC-barrel domain
MQIRANELQFVPIEFVPMCYGVVATTRERSARIFSRFGTNLNRMKISAWHRICNCNKSTATCGHASAAETGNQILGGRLIMSTRLLGLSALGALLACGVVGYVIAADKETDAKNSTSATHHFRASTIDGMRIRNSRDEDLGTVKDLVVDLESGKVVYAALDFGGFIGIGDKLFAVPWSAFKFHATSDGRNQFLILNVSKERLQNAPGFDKSHWPEMGDPSWSKVDDFYGPPKTTQRVR